MTRKKNPTTTLRHYKIVWEIDVYSDNPIGAAESALNMQRDDLSCATIFGVLDNKSGRAYTVDISRTVGEPSTSETGYDLCFKQDKGIE